MEEVATTESSGMGKWLVPLIVLPLLAGAIVVGYLMLPVDGSNTPVNSSSDSAPAIPSLGSRGHPIETAPNEEPVANSDEPPPVSGDGGETDPPPEFANSEREIDIWLSNLAIATRSGDRRGVGLNHEMLRKARPDELVDQRVRNALESEESAAVRIQYFLAFHEAAAKHDWAMHVYDTRTAKFMGADDQYSGGEVEELRLIVRELYTTLASSWQSEELGDTRLMALVRNVLDTLAPAWLLEETAAQTLRPMVEHHLVSFARAIQQELRSFLLRRTAVRAQREIAFAAYVLTFDPHTAVLTELENSEWWDYASALAALFPERNAQRDIGTFPKDGFAADWIKALLASPELPQLFEHLLQGAMPPEDKSLLIQRIANFDVPEGRAMIEAGLARKDANYPDYLTAFGTFALTDADLQRLTAAANDPDISAAAGAIEGLRQSGLSAADAELRKVLEQGFNLGVKSQALGALLSRAADKSALLEEYLDPNKDSSLRAVAVSAVPITDFARLQRVAEEDISPTVRLAAVNRIGGIQPATAQERKDLHGWFVKIKTRDSSPVIRAAARKYAEATQD